MQEISGAFFFLYWFKRGRIILQSIFQDLDLMEDFGYK